MKKITKTVLWLTGIMFGAFIIGAIVVFATGAPWYFNDHNLHENNINSTEIMNLSGFDELEIITISTDVNIEPTDNDELKIHFHGYANYAGGSEPPRIEIVKEDGVISMEIKRYFSWSSFEDLDLDLYVPKDQIDNFEIKTTSGDTRIYEIEAQSIEFSSISGDLKTGDLLLDKFKIHTVSGDSILDSSNVEDFILSTTSGDLKFEGIMKASDIKTVSGRVSIVSNMLEESWKIKTTSGDVILNVPDDSLFNIDFKSTSGDARTSFQMTTTEVDDNVLIGSTGDSDVMVNIHTVSGDLSLD